MADTLALTVPRSLEAFDGLIPAVDAWLDAEGVSGRAVNVAHLVLEEVLRNLVEHARGVPAGFVTVEMRLVPPHLRVAVEDDCEPFDPRDAPSLDTEAPLEERRAGGMGLHLLQTMTDALRYERRGDRNRLEVDIALSERAEA